MSSFADVSAWPTDLRPEVAPVYTRNERFIDASCEAVWAPLIRAAGWPEFYANSADVRFERGEGPDLAPGTVFSWRTFGLRVRTRVVEFQPNRCLAWRGDELYGRGLHTWLLVPERAGCLVVTEEVQSGLIPFVARWYLRRGLLRWHQQWLDGLAERASARDAGSQAADSPSR